MKTPKEIKHRHGWDRWKDAGFIGAVVLLTALALGAVTSKAVGTNDHQWGVTVSYSDLEIGR